MYNSQIVSIRITFDRRSCAPTRRRAILAVRHGRSESDRIAPHNAWTDWINGITTRCFTKCAGNTASTTPCISSIVQHHWTTHAVATASISDTDAAEIGAPPDRYSMK